MSKRPHQQETQPQKTEQQMKDGDSCRIDESARMESDAIGGILSGKRVAVVGLSAEPDRASYGISQYLQEHG